MIGAGEIKLNLPDIQGPNGTYDVLVDIDFPKDFLPNLSLYPVAQDARNDVVHIRTEYLPDGKKQLRFVFETDELAMNGLFGPKKTYSLVLNQHGHIYAQKRKQNSDEKKYDASQYETTWYNVDTGDWNGAAERIANLMAEGVAGWDLDQQLADNRIVSQNPAYGLALWLDSHRLEATKSLPAEEKVLLAKIRSSGEAMAVDVDKVKPYPPSLGVVTVTPQTTINRAFVSSRIYLGKPALLFAFRSEVDVPEIGQKRAADHKPGELDDWCTRVTLLTESGIHVFAIQDKDFKKELIPTPAPVLGADRLVAILAGALIAVGVRQNPPRFAQQLASVASRVSSLGEIPLPKEVQIEPGVGFLQWLSEHSGDWTPAMGPTAAPMMDF